jgi:thymidylate synthase
MRILIGLMFEKSIKYGFELHWDQRSTFLALPYNIASYATLAKKIEVDRLL